MRALTNSVAFALFFGCGAAACGVADPNSLDRVGYGNEGASADGAVEIDASKGDAMAADDGASGDAAVVGDAGSTETATSSADGGDAAIDRMHPDAGAPVDAAPDVGAADAAVAAANAFTGDPTYVATTGTTSENAAHDFAGNTPTTNPAGQPCLTCHGAAGPGKAFVFGGTVWTSAAAIAPAPQIEVRVRDNNAIGFATFSDADGNFFSLLGAAGTFAPPAHPGIRNATTTDVMTGAIDNGNCNDCHRLGGQTPIHL